MSPRPYIVGVSGGTGSGKTTVVQKITETLGADDVLVIFHDSYYRDRSHLSPEERGQINYDHPDALETDLLIAHVKELIAGNPVEVPLYDYATHTRCQDKIRIFPSRIIIIEGILIFVDPNLRSLMDLRVFVDTDDDVRFIRRMERDIRERARSRESVVQQYLSTVRPMHLEFVEPSKRYADIIIPEGGFNTAAVDLMTTKISTLVEGCRRGRDDQIDQ